MPPESSRKRSDEEHSARGKKRQRPFIDGVSNNQQQQPSSNNDAGQTSLTFSRSFQLIFSGMDGPFAKVTIHESRKSDVTTRMVFLEHKVYLSKFIDFLRNHTDKNLIRIVDTFPLGPEDLQYLSSRVDGIEFANKSSRVDGIAIAYPNYKSTVHQLLQDKPEIIWNSETTHGLTPVFQRFLNEFLDSLCDLHKNGLTHGEVENLERCVLMSEDDLDDFKVIPSGKEDINEEGDLKGLRKMMTNIPRPRDYICLYYEDAKDFLINSERSVKDTLKIFKEHPFLAPRSNIIKMAENASQSWNQCPKSKSAAESRFFEQYITKRKYKHYQDWCKRIKDGTKTKEKRAEKELKSAKQQFEREKFHRAERESEGPEEKLPLAKPELKLAQGGLKLAEQNKKEAERTLERARRKANLIYNMGDCMRDKLYSYNGTMFVDLVRYIYNKSKHVWDEHGNEVRAIFTKAEFTDSLIELFPEIHIILFHYFYCSKSHFRGAKRKGEKYWCEGYSITAGDLRY